MYLTYYQNVIGFFQPVDGTHQDHKMMDLVTTLRSELAAANYKRDRLISQVCVYFVYKKKV